MSFQSSTYFSAEIPNKDRHLSPQPLQATKSLARKINGSTRLPNTRAGRPGVLTHRHHSCLFASQAHRVPRTRHPGSRSCVPRGPTPPPPASVGPDVRASPVASHPLYASRPSRTFGVASPTRPEGHHHPLVGQLPFWLTPQPTASDALMRPERGGIIVLLVWLSS